MATILDCSRIGVLSDAHGHGPAFALAVDVLIRAGAERLVFLGDAVGYIPSTHVLDAIATLGTEIQCIAGNHDQMLLSLASNERDEVYRHTQVRSLLLPHQRKMIASWPDQITDSSNSILFVHGSPTDPTNGYVYPDSDLTRFASDTKWVLMGHTHRPFVRWHNRTCYVNVGSCGLPRDDGRFGSVCLLDVANNQAKILRFDISEATRKMLDEYSSQLHFSVTKLFERRQANLEGELI